MKRVASPENVTICLKKRPNCLVTLLYCNYLMSIQSKTHQNHKALAHKQTYHNCVVRLGLAHELLCLMFNLLRFINPVFKMGRFNKLYITCT